MNVLSNKHFTFFPGRDVVILSEIFYNDGVR